MICLRKEISRAAILLAALACTTPATAQFNWSDVEYELATSPFLRGALVIKHDDDIVYANGFGNWQSYNEDEVLLTSEDNVPPAQQGDDPGPNPIREPINVASLSKSFAAVVAIAAIEDSNVAEIVGGVSVDLLSYDTLVDSLVDTRSGVSQTMQIRHLLNMTNGQKSSTGGFPLNPLTCINNPLFDFSTCGENQADTAQAKRNANPGGLFPQNVPLAPGESFSYGPLPWQVLGLATLRAVNQGYGASYSFTDIVEMYLTGPCGMNDTTYDIANNEWVAGGVNTNPRDAIVLAEVMLTGKCGSHTVLSADGLAHMRDNKLDDTLYEPVTNPDSSGLGYGMGLWTHPVTSGAEPAYYYGIGAWGAITFFSPDGEWSAYLHLNDHLLTGYVDATELARTIAPLIDAQIAANP